MTESEQASDRFCRSCQHCLRGIASEQCPECGHAFDPNDPSTTWASPRRPMWDRLAKLCRIISRGCAVLTVIATIVVLLGYDRPRLTMVPCCIGFVLVWLCWVLVLCPWVPLTKRQRVAGLIFPPLLMSIDLTRWPLLLCVFICPPWINYVADQTQSKGLLTWRTPSPTFQRGRAIDNGNVGYLLMGNRNSGYYLVRVNPNAPPLWPNQVWMNTTFEQPLGGQWFLVFHD